MVRQEPTADVSFAAIFDLIKLGMAIAPMMRMIATTIRSSTSENPLLEFLFCNRLVRIFSYARTPVPFSWFSFGASVPAFFSYGVMGASFLSS